MPRLLLPLRRHFEARSPGQALVEFALILPVFLVFFGTVLDLGRIAAAQVTVSNAAREGALQASKTPASFDNTAPCPAGSDPKSNLVVCRTMLEATNTSVGIAPADISLTCDPDCSAALDHRVTVKVTGHFQLLTPFLTPFFGGKQTILFGVASTTQIEKLPPPPSPVILTSAPPSPTPTPTATPTATPTPTPTPAPTPTPTGGTCAQPSAGFTTSFSPASRKLSGGSVVLTVTDTSTTSTCSITWYWEFFQVQTDGTKTSMGTSFDRNPAPRSYGSVGTYSVYLTVTNSVGQKDTTGGTVFEIRP